jgi:hypothetical protein
MKEVGVKERERDEGKQATASLYEIDGARVRAPPTEGGRWCSHVNSLGYDY